MERTTGDTIFYRKEVTTKSWTLSPSLDEKKPENLLRKTTFLAFSSDQWQEKGVRDIAAQLNGSINTNQILAEDHCRATIENQFSTVWYTLCTLVLLLTRRALPVKREKSLSSRAAQCNGGAVVLKVVPSKALYSSP